MPRKRKTGETQLDTLALAKKAITEKYGKDVILSIGEVTKFRGDVIPTNALNLNLALGCGGIPRGRITEIWGKSGTGKTTIMYQTIANAQKLGLNCVYINMEFGLDVKYAKGLGVDVDSIIFLEPETGDDAMNMIDTFAKTGNVGLICLDSVPALIPKEEREIEIGDKKKQRGLLASLMSESLRKLAGAVAQGNTALVFLNQLRATMNPYGPAYKPPGGEALEFYAGLRLELVKTAVIKQGDEILGSRIKCKIAKNKGGPRFHHVEFDLLNYKGISKEGVIIDMGLECGAIEASGVWYKDKNGNALAQGREGIRSLLEENKELAEQLEKQIITAYNAEI